MERNYVEEVFKKQAGEKVCLKGWVYDARDLKKVRFIVLRDITGRVQVTGVQSETPAEAFEGLNGISRESAVEVIGTIKDCKQAPGGKEIAPEKITILAMAANPIPIDVSDYSKTELPIRLDYRFLDLHREKTQAIFKIQSTIMQAYREYMVKEERALEGVFPSIIGSSSEGGTELFEAKYFEKKAFLSQSCQLYKQMLACSMEKVFTIFTVWRAEKHNTVRHLNEARQMDFEMAFTDEFGIMDVLAKSVIYTVKKVIETNSKELKLLNVDLKVPAVKYMTFAEAAKIMKEANVGMPKHDLSGEAEKKLDELYPDTIVFVHDWPEEGRGFYIMPKEGPNGEKVSHGFDAIYKGIEISSGGQRVHLPELLTDRLKAKGLNPVQFKDYIDSFRYGAPPHGGFGIGLERITMIMLGLDNIREAVLFPRDRDRLTP